MTKHLAWTQTGGGVAVSEPRGQRDEETEEAWMNRVIVRMKETGVIEKGVDDLCQVDIADMPPDRSERGKWRLVAGKIVVSLALAFLVMISPAHADIDIVTTQSLAAIDVSVRNEVLPDGDVVSHEDTLAFPGTVGWHRVMMDLTGVWISSPGYVPFGNERSIGAVKLPAQSYWKQIDNEVRYNGGLRVVAHVNTKGAWLPIDLDIRVPPWARMVEVRGEAAREPFCGNGTAQVDFAGSGNNGYGTWIRAVRGWTRVNEPETLAYAWVMIQQPGVIFYHTPNTDCVWAHVHITGYRF